MKKNISINISGIIFHIEEDGYDQLKGYLDSIIRYFATYEDSQEIIVDIENRIAEILSGKLAKGKEVITAEDVAFLMTTMGTVSDFEATEDKEDKSHVSATKETPDPSYETRSGKLYRDLKRKLLGGVASGIADYLKTDSIWIRLAFVAVFFGISFVPALSGFILLVYIILWVVLPGSELLASEEQVKKLYRHPDDRKVAGVCSGLATYFGVDATLVRILFFIGIFLGGSTIIVYLVLATITPEAKTTTEKMRMQGEPITLSNIESNIRNSFNIKEDKEESVLAKVLSLPFRILASVSKALMPVLLSLGDAVRVALGLFLSLIPFVVLGVLVMAAAIFLGYTSSISGFQSLVHPFVDIIAEVLPLDVIIATLPKMAVVALICAFAIPLIFMSLLGICLLAKRNIIHPAIGWFFSGLFVLAVLVAASSVPGFVKDYRREVEFAEEQSYPMHAKSILLNANPNEEILYNKVKLHLEGYEGNEVKLVKEYYARGSSRQDATENAKMIEYTVTAKDSTLTFNWSFSFKKEALFRGQDLELWLYIPYGKEFVVGEDMREILNSKIFRKGDNRHFEIENNKWVFEEDGLRCINCVERKRRKRDSE